MWRNILHEKVLISCTNGINWRRGDMCRGYRRHWLRERRSGLRSHFPLLRAIFSWWHRRCFILVHHHVLHEGCQPGYITGHGRYLIFKTLYLLLQRVNLFLLGIGLACFLNFCQEVWASSQELFVAESPMLCMQLLESRVDLNRVSLYFSEPIEVELPHKRREVVVFEELRDDLCCKLLRILHNKRIPFFRPTCYRWVTCIDHMVGFSEEDGAFRACLPFRTLLLPRHFRRRRLLNGGNDR
mmetsp:Transcript_38540/g.71231  ORF Transcript_38540/g.71231 Transcript_38540/m.71231 type:complete len:241 (+) Transcript_38540:108-830(+)